MEKNVNCVKNADTDLKRIVFMGLAILYRISPVDVIPDFIPILGWVDDVVVALMAGRQFLR